MNQGQTSSPDAEALEVRLGAMKAHPRIDEALRHSVSAALDYFHANQVMHRNVRDIGRLILGVVALYLDATGGLTHRRLRALSGQTGVISAGTATAVLFRMRAIGYVHREETGGSGLQRRYVPTPEMVRAFQDRLRFELEAAAMVIDGCGAILPRYEEPGVFRAVIAVMGRETMQAVRNPRPDLDALNRLSVRTAGLLVLFDIVHAADRPGAPFAAEAEVEVSVAALARRYEISRSHVLSILRDLSAADFLERLSSDGLWRIKPALRDALLTFFTVIYAGMAGVESEALAALDGAG